jgi:hypothetical protein
LIRRTTSQIKPAEQANARNSMLPPGGLQHLIGLQLVSPFSVLNGTLHLAASVLIKRQPKKIVKEL